MDSTMKNLPPDIQSLLESERGVVPPAPDGARERVLSRVHATVGLAAPAALASASAPATAAAGAGSSALPLGVKWAAAVLAGAVFSTVIYLAVRSPQPPAPSSVAPPALVAAPSAQPASPAPAIVTATPSAAAPAAVPAAEPPAIAGPVVADDPSAVH